MRETKQKESTETAPAAAQVAASTQQAAKIEGTLPPAIEAAPLSPFERVRSQVEKWIDALQIDPKIEAEIAKTFKNPLRPDQEQVFDILMLGGNEYTSYLLEDQNPDDRSVDSSRTLAACIGRAYTCRKLLDQDHVIGMDLAGESRKTEIAENMRPKLTAALQALSSKSEAPLRTLTQRQINGRNNETEAAFLKGALSVYFELPRPAAEGFWGGMRRGISDWRFAPNQYLTAVKSGDLFREEQTFLFALAGLPQGGGWRKTPEEKMQAAAYELSAITGDTQMPVALAAKLVSAVQTHTALYDTSFYQVLDHYPANAAFEDPKMVHAFVKELNKWRRHQPGASMFFHNDWKISADTQGVTALAVGATALLNVRKIEEPKKFELVLEGVDRFLAKHGNSLPEEFIKDCQAFLKDRYGQVARDAV